MTEVTRTRSVDRRAFASDARCYDDAMSARSLLLAVAFVGCAPSAGVTAPCAEAPNAISDPARAMASTPAPAAPVCSLLGEVDAARELSRQMNGDAMILKYSTSFTEHASVVAIARAAGAVAVEPMIVLSADVIGPHGFRPVVVRGTDPVLMRAFRPHVIAGSLDAIERTEGVPEIGIGAELAASIGANVGDVVALASQRSDLSAMTPATLANAMYHVVGASELDRGFRSSVEALRVYCTPSPM